MKAGTALGLLAGLGAMNAMSGKPYGGKRFTGLMDMLDGGGAGQSGDKFEGGGLLSMLGNLFMKPMQAQQNVERIGDKVRAEKLGMTTGTPITEYSDSLLAPIVNQDVYGIGNAGEYGGVPSVTPDVYNIGSAGEFGGAMATNNLSNSDVLSGGIVQPMPASSQEANISAGGLLSAPDMPVREGLPLPRDAEGILAPELPASERNTELVSFNRRMETVPEMFRGSEVEGMYRDYLLNGGLGTFAQFTNQSMATEDPTVKRSPTPPALTSPDLPIEVLKRRNNAKMIVRTEVMREPSLRKEFEERFGVDFVREALEEGVSVAPAAPQPQPVSVSDLPYADQIVAARQAVMREKITPDMLESKFGVDFAREVMNGIQMMGGKTAVPNIPLGPLSIQRLHQTMPITRFN